MIYLLKIWVISHKHDYAISYTTFIYIIFNMYILFALQVNDLRTMWVTTGQLYDCALSDSVTVQA